jgi:hypothetical protein
MNRLKKPLNPSKDYVVEKFPLLEGVVNNMFNLSLSN